MEKRLFLLLSVVFLFVFGCEQSITPPTESASDQQEVQMYQIALAKGQHTLVTEYKLRAMAQALAKSLENPSVGLHLRQKISERFDGDYNVLWNDVKDYQLKGNGKLRAMVGNRLPSMIEQISDIETVSNLQIALPMGTESWDGTTPIKVAYDPQTIDDTELEYIPAFDNEGNEHKLDADTPPNYPVLVVSKNERTDNSGKVIYHGNKSIGLARLTTPPDDGGGGGGGGTTTDYKSIYFEWFQTDYFGEPWHKGDPEFRMYLASGQGTSLIYNWGDEYGHWHIWGYERDISVGSHNHIHDYLFRWSEELGDYVGVNIWEVDGNRGDKDVNITVPLIINGVEVGTVTETWKRDSGDDHIGKNELINVAAPPLFSDRNYQPDPDEMEPAGSQTHNHTARLTFWY